VARRTMEVRQEEILQATVAEISDRGLANVRVSDVAGRLGISSALVYYHFATKERLISAAYQYAAAEDMAGLERLAGAGGPAVDRLRAILRFSLPAGSSMSWELWIDAWSAALRWDEVRRTSRAMDRRWKEKVAQVIADGVASGEFVCPEPQAAAWRLTALIDGLAIQIVSNRSAIRRGDVARWVAAAAGAEVGVPMELLS